MGRIHQEDKTIISLVHELKTTTSKYMKKTLTELKGKTDSNTIIIIGDGNTPLSTMDGSFRVDQLGNRELEHHHRANGPKDIQNIPPHNSRIYILLKCT